MKKFLDWIDSWTPILWGILWTLTITFGSVVAFVFVIKLLLGMMGVL